MRLLTGLAVTLCLLAAAPAVAQDGTVRGVVRDSTGKPLGDADVSIVELHQLTRTDDRGNFMFTKLPRGEHEVMIRRLGYTPETIKVMVNEMAYSYSVTLAARPAVLEAVQTNASEARLLRGLEDFYRRRARGTGGTFFTRDDIMARNAHRTSDVIRTTPGVRMVRTKAGSGVRFAQTSSSKSRDCLPMIWMDGQEAAGMEIDDIPVGDIEAMEVYAGPSTTPSQFSSKWSKESCGAIVVWTRIPGTP